jgi:histone H3/H4
VLICHSDETEDLRRLGKSPSVALGSDVFEEANGDDDNEDTFKLQFPNQAIEPRRDVLPSSEEEWESGPELAGNDETDAGEDLDSPVAPPARRQTLTPIEAAAPTLVSRRKRVKLTRHGIAVPSLPSSIIKRLAVESVTRRGKRKPVIDKASLTALEQAKEWFFEQVGEDLEAYSNHARRKKRVDASDVLTLMRRQRLLRDPGRLQDLAEQVLPPEALVELDLPESL